MNNTFFGSLAEITSRTDLNLTIKTKDGIMSVLVMPKAITMSGTPAELDGGFLEAISKPFAKAEGLTVNAPKAETVAKSAAAAKPEAKKTPEQKPAATPKEAARAKPVNEPGSLFTIPVDEDDEDLAVDAEEIGGGGVNNHE